MTTNPSQNHKSKLVPAWKLALFFGYCGLGITGFGIFTFKIINIRNSLNDQTTSSRTKILQSPAFRKIVLNGVLFFFITQLGLTFGFILGLAYVIKFVKPADLFLKEITQMNKMYSD